jgi:uncharacterized protein
MPVSERNITAGPATPAERITALDTTRGVAVLGILIMNIWSFAGPQAIFDYPLAAADQPGAAVATWAAMHTLFEGSQRAIFSMLFGAGMLLMVGRLDEHATGASSARLYYRRLMFLMLFGLFDMFILLWPGDILLIYSLVGLVLYPLRNLKPVALLALALLVFAVHNGLHYAELKEVTAQQLEFSPDYGGAAPAEDVDELTRDRYESWQSTYGRARPDLDSEQVRERIRVISTGGLGEFVIEQAITSLVLFFVLGLKFMFLDALGMMLVGMALLRSGFLTLKLPARIYWLTLAAGYGVGIPMAGWETATLIATDFDPRIGAQFQLQYDLRRLLVGLGHLSLILMCCRYFPASWLGAKLAAVGRMALTNYLLQTVICTLIFTTVGFGLYGSFTGYYLYFVVAGVWVALIAFSSWWLERNPQGPAERLWRRLTYRA